jgi:hypothetical protein
MTDKQRSTGGRIKEVAAGKIQKDEQKIGGDFKITKNPAFLEERVAVFERIYKTQQD